MCVCSELAAKLAEREEGLRAREQEQAKEQARLQRTGAGVIDLTRNLKEREAKLLAEVGAWGGLGRGHARRCMNVPAS